MANIINLNLKPNDQSSRGRTIWIDREFSWLDFNHRVLDQSLRDDMPVSKRLSFIGIAANNLTEFVSVRFAGAYRTESAHYMKTLKKSVIEQKKLIESYFMEKNVQYNIIDGDEVLNTLEKTDALYKSIYKVFRKQIYPVLTPITVGTNKEIPRLNELDVNFFLKLRAKNSDESIYCFLPIPHQIPRVYNIEGKRYLIEDIIKLFLDDIFNSVSIKSYILFTVNKDYSAEITLDNNESVVTKVTDALIKRDENNFIFLDIMTYKSNKDSTKIIKYLCKLLHVHKDNKFVTEKAYANAIGLHFLGSAGIKIEENIAYPKTLYNTKFKPKVPLDLEDANMFDVLDDEDILLHHPYDSYDPVVTFLKQAASDPKVISIKQTLYRVSSTKSPIVKALSDAARNGIQVTVMIELLARFDERRNIGLIRKLKSAGVNIVYSLQGLKTHCKMCLVVKATKHGMKTYSHMSTGNYNEKTARIYTDISYFTSRPSIGFDLNSLFNMITGLSRPGSHLKAISYSPDTLRPRLIEEITKVCEEPFAKDEKNTTREIWIKCNSISDEEMVQFILEKADAYPDVKFNIICRGICSLPSRENIIIKSIVGRFLEHSRIYIFEHGKSRKVFISSADFLTRNLDKRVESLIYINDSKSSKKIYSIVQDMWLDTANSYMLCSDDTWKKVKYDNDEYFNYQNRYTLK